MNYPTRSIREGFKPVPAEQLDAAILKSNVILTKLLNGRSPDRILIAFSGGKDSIVVAGLAVAKGIRTAHCETAFCFPKDVAQYKDIAEKIGLNCDFAASLDIEWLQHHQEMIFGPLPMLSKYYAARQQRGVAKRAKSMHAQAVIYGRRHEENTVPDTIYTRRDNLTQCNPIAHWTHEEVWTYVLQSGWGYPSIYEHPVGRLNGAASWPEVSEELSRADGYNHLEIIHDYDPTVLPAIRHWRPDVDAFLKGKEMPDTKKTKHPLEQIEWVDPQTLHANDYNPNHVAPVELELLRLSILADGWTQPIVARADGEIVDGFHRWTLGSKDKSVREASGGLVPVVRIAPSTIENQMMATIRHNRARGQHNVRQMSSIVLKLREAMADEDIASMLGMEDEEIDRLSDLAGMIQRGSAEGFNAGWVPDDSAREAGEAVADGDGPA